MVMEENVGSTDQIVRIALGAVLGLASLGILANMVPGPQIASPVLGVVSLMLLATGFTSKCYVYNLAGMDTSE